MTPKAMAASGELLTPGKAAQAAVPNLRLNEDGRPVAKKGGIKPIIPKPVVIPDGARVMVRTKTGVEVPKLLPEVAPRAMASVESAWANVVVKDRDGGKHLSRSVGSQKLISDKPQPQQHKAIAGKRQPLFGAKAKENAEGAGPIGSGSMLAPHGLPQPRRSVIRGLRGSILGKLPDNVRASALRLSTRSSGGSQKDVLESKKAPATVPASSADGSELPGMTAQAATPSTPSQDAFGAKSTPAKRRGFFSRMLS